MRNNQKMFGTVFCTIFLIYSIVSLSGINKPFTSFGNGDGPVSKALNYLRNVQQSDGCISDFATSSWAVMAIAATGEDPHNWRVGGGPSIVDYLIANRHMLDLGRASDVERFILSMTAADEDSRDVNGTDYVEILKSHFVNGQIGDEEWLFDDFWGVLALVSTGQAANSTVVHETVEFIKGHQNSDGGWGWAVGAGSDVDDTAAAIMSLISAGEGNSTEVVKKALQYLRNNQQPDGGFPSWGVTNSASDSWAIGAICSSGQDPAEWQVNGTSVIDHLLSLQNADSSFNWTRSDPLWVNRALMTSYVIVALCLRQYPVNGLPIYIRIEGSQATIWRRKVFVAASIIIDDQGQEHYFTEPIALGALDKAAEVGGLDYKVKQTSWGLYLYSVAGEEAIGAKGWMYRVDYVMPWVGMGAFIWNATSPPSPPHKELLLYYGEWTDLPLKITVDKTMVHRGDTVTVFVEYFNDTEQLWRPLEGAIVYFLSGQSTTNATGYTMITILVDPPVWTEKGGFIRSDIVRIRWVGDITGPGGWPDGKVDMRDVGLAAKAFGSYPGHPRWNPIADINNDKKVDMKDIGAIAKQFGKTDP